MKHEQFRHPYSFGIYEKAMPPTLPISEKLLVAAKHGYDFMELSIDESDEKLARLDASAEWKRELCDAAQNADIRVSTMCLSGHRKYPIGSTDPKTRAHGMEIMRGAILLAADIGIRIIQIAGYDAYYEPSTETTRALFADNLEESVAFASRYGVCLAFETMETPFMNTVEKALEFVQKINSPFLQIYPDVGNVTNALGGDTSRISNDILSGAGHLVAVHLKETRPGVFREVPYGQGHVNFDSCIEAAFLGGARLFTSEFWFQRDTDWELDIEQASTFLRTKLDRISHGE
ncbi:MAG TPA: L-ribulose-5-phosphate 4-epimerase [Spirochaetaceae bacterium]|nr:L-ribulose-5-phosphate 4-epimerase [Spirochaetaceae bacterium]